MTQRQTWQERAECARLPPDEAMRIFFPDRSRWPGVIPPHAEALRSLREAAPERRIPEPPVLRALRDRKGAGTLAHPQWFVLASEEPPTKGTNDDTCPLDRGGAGALCPNQRSRIT